MQVAPQAYFITGTDTGVGKTLIASALMHTMAGQGRRVAGMKPVASGATWHDGAWHNDDVDALQAAANLTFNAALVNPYLLQEPAAPHIAAAAEGIGIDLDHIERCYQTLCASADTVIVEGVGGFIVPLNDHCDTADLVCRLDLPVILVVGIRLGCISHALLTIEAIAARGLHLAGWVANLTTPETANVTPMIATLQRRINAPLLGCVPCLPAADAAGAAHFLDMTALLTANNTSR